MAEWTVRTLLKDFKSGRINRRQFITALTRMGIPVGVVAAMLASCTGGVEPAGGGDVPSSNEVPFEPKQRGGGGQLKMLYWQAPSTLNPHMTRGTKDVDASSLFYEQLLYIDGDASFVPRLISEVPRVDNGMLDPAGKWVVWKLKSGVQWHGLLGRLAGEAEEAGQVLGGLRRLLCADHRVLEAPAPAVADAIGHAAIL